jgi:hypothetical protein
MLAIAGLLVACERDETVEVYHYRNYPADRTEGRDRYFYDRYDDYYYLESHYRDGRLVSRTKIPYGY